MEIRRDFAAPTKLIGQYPRGGWTAELKPTEKGMQITVAGSTDDRLLVLQ